MTKLILISGIPGAGKSTYGMWLQKEKGFVFWDLEHERLEEVGQRVGLNIGTGHDINKLLQVAHSENLTIILDWGFPPDQSLGQVQYLLDKGFAPWWFDGDRNAAKESFINRGTVSVEDFNVQMSKIELYWEEIQKLFPNRINNVMAGQKYLDPNEVCRIMFR